LGGRAIESTPEKNMTTIVRRFVVCAMLSALPFAATAQTDRNWDAALRK
jgi:hypothetical protein